MCSAWDILCKFRRIGLRFQRCCERAYQSSLKLLSILSGMTVEKIDKSYKRHCDSTEPLTAADLELEEDEMPDHQEDLKVEDPEEESDKANDCMNLLSTVQRETLFTDPELEKSEDDPMVEPSAFEIQCLMDSKQMQQLIENPAGPDPTPAESVSKGKEYMPSTLGEALELPGDVFNALFRLCCKLRAASGGIDKEWINNGRHVRKASPKLNWHQCLVLSSSVMFSDGIGVCSFSICRRVFVFSGGLMNVHYFCFWII